MERQGKTRGEEAVKKQVLTFLKPAQMEPMTVADIVTEVTKVEPFDDIEKRPCIEVETSGILGEGGLSSVYLPDETVLVIE